MKKFLPLFMGSLMALLLFVTPGNLVKADSYVPEAKDFIRNFDCGCEAEGFIPVSGAERNQIVAGLLSSDGFNAKKQEVISKGYQFLGADLIKVVHADTPFGALTGVSVFFLSNEGTIEGYVWVNGQFAGHSPYPGDME